MMEPCSRLDPEILERRFPVKLLEFSIRKGSGGKGMPTDPTEDSYILASFAFPIIFCRCCSFVSLVMPRPV
jgi:hypothetical protein